MSNEFIITSSENQVGRIILNRPEVHNALHIGMIREITEAVRQFDDDEDTRIIFITANGTNFCAGADLHWMKQGLEQSRQELYHESKELALLFNQIYHASKITVSLARGKVMGGANGIVAATDIPLATTDAAFAFSEVKLGLIPATIAPYIIQRTGHSAAMEWMLSGRMFSAGEAFQKGLISWILTSEEAEQPEQKVIGQLLRNGPNAMHGVKQMLRKHYDSMDPDELLEETSQLIASFRVSPEGQEGIRAFFEKRQPNWSNE